MEFHRFTVSTFFPSQINDYNNIICVILVHHHRQHRCTYIISYKQNFQYLFKRKHTLMILYPNTHCAFRSPCLRSSRFLPFWENARRSCLLLKRLRFFCKHDLTHAHINDKIENNNIICLGIYLFIMYILLYYIVFGIK